MCPDQLPSGFQAIAGVHPPQTNTQDDQTGRTDHGQSEPRAAITDPNHAIPDAVNNIEERVRMAQCLYKGRQGLDRVKGA